MSLNEIKTHDTTTAVTPQQHHTQAAEHLEHAAKSHKEVAKLIVAGDHKAAQAHTLVAKEHTVKAQEHVAEAVKKSAAVAK
jgi:hypothetical protein